MYQFFIFVQKLQYFTTTPFPVQFKKEENLFKKPENQIVIPAIQIKTYRFKLKVQQFKLKK